MDARPRSWADHMALLSGRPSGGSGLPPRPALPSFWRSQLSQKTKSVTFSQTSEPYNSQEVTDSQYDSQPGAGYSQTPDQEFSETQADPYIQYLSQPELVSTPVQENSGWVGLSQPVNPVVKREEPRSAVVESSLCLELYSDIYSSLVRGDKDGKVLPCTGLDELKFRRGDLKKILAIHGLADGSSKSRKDVLASLVGMRMWLPFCENLKTIQSKEIPTPPLDEVKQDLLSMGWLDSPVNELLKLEMKATEVAAAADLGTQVPESQIDPGSPQATCLKGLTHRPLSEPKKSLVAEAVGRLLKMEKCQPIDLPNEFSKSKTTPALTCSKLIKQEAAELLDALVDCGRMANDTDSMMVVSIPRLKLVNSSTSTDELPDDERAPPCGHCTKQTAMEKSVLPEQSMRERFVQSLKNAKDAVEGEQQGSKCEATEHPKPLEQQVLAENHGKTSVHTEGHTDTRNTVCGDKNPGLSTAPQIKIEAADDKKDVFKRPFSPNLESKQIPAAAIDWVSLENQVLRFSLHLQIDTNPVKPNLTIGRTVIVVSLKGIGNSHRKDITEMQPGIHLGKVMRTVKKSHISGICTEGCKKSHSPFRIRPQGGHWSGTADMTADLSDSMRMLSWDDLWNAIKAKDSCLHGAWVLTNGAELPVTKSQRQANMHHRQIMHHKRKSSKVAATVSFLQHDLKLGSLVWANNRGIWWPAEITRAAGEDVPFGDVEVELFGEPQVRMDVARSSLKPFLENAAQHNCGKHSSAFRTAVAAAMLRASPTKEEHDLECREQVPTPCQNNSGRKRRRCR